MFHDEEGGGGTGCRTYFLDSILYWKEESHWKMRCRLLATDILMCGPTWELAIKKQLSHFSFGNWISSCALSRGACGLWAPQPGSSLVSASRSVQVKSHLHGHEEQCWATQSKAQPSETGKKMLTSVRLGIDHRGLQIIGPGPATSSSYPETRLHYQRPEKLEGICRD